MRAAGMLKDKIKRRRINKDLEAEKLNSATADHQKPAVDQVLRKSSRISFLRKRPATTETMVQIEQDAEQTAKSTLSRQIKMAGDSRAYQDDRNALLDVERKSAWDAPAKSRASPAEVKANSILLKIRENERIDPTLFGNLPSEAVPDPDSRDMGGRFLVNKARIERSRVFEIASKMPKGAHLHLHFNSEMPPEKLLPYARRPEMEDTMCIRSTKPLLHLSDFDECEVLFDVLPKEAPKGDIFSRDYDPTKFKHKDGETVSWMRWVDFRQRFPDDVPLENGRPRYAEITDVAEYWVCEKTIITLKNAYNDRQTTNGAWACFNQGTRAFKGLLNYEGVYRWYIGNAVESMIRDKVMYTELRPMLLDKSIPANDGKRRLSHKDQMMIVCEETAKKKEELKAQGKLHLFPFGVKIIYCAPRSITRDMMKTELRDCLALKLQFPDLICGFDLVGAEDRPNHIGFYADLLVGFANTCKELGVDIPFMFHAGESLIDTGGSHSPDNSNLYDALLLNSKRIGHGYSLLKHPLLAQRYRDRKICLELCPISNELLHLCGNARQHIFPELLAAGLQCTLNADNPSLFSSSLSHEFYQVMVGDPRMNIHGWKQLAEWSLEHSCLSEEQLVEAKTIYAQEWDAFCQWVIDAHEQYASGLKDLM